MKELTKSEKHGVRQNEKVQQKNVATNERSLKRALYVDRITRMIEGDCHSSNS